MPEPRLGRMGPPYVMLPDVQSEILNGNKADNESPKATTYRLEYYLGASMCVTIALVILYQGGALRSLFLDLGAVTIPPAVSPGSCVVYRPLEYVYELHGLFGQNCTAGVPEYVARFTGKGFVETGANLLPTGSAARSVFGWILYNYSSDSGGEAYAVQSYGADNASSSGLYISNGNVCFWDGKVCYGKDQIPENTWVFVGYTIRAYPEMATVYIDGKVAYYENLQQAPGTPVVNSTIGAGIGKRCGGICYYMNGLISNVQIYNTAMTPEEVNMLYQEGIGGVPIDTQHIVGWWPLNHNANDYSGNFNNGTAENVTFVRNWSGNYATPVMCSAFNFILRCTA